jgi:flagellar biosynthesis/type III secretory pathway protein FliH
LEKGREEGLAEGREQALEESWQTHQLELEQAEADKARALQELREELEGQIEPLKQQLNDAVEQVQSLLGRPEKLYEPVKRLSLHLAEQLVLGELNLSSAAIERLIQRCLDELDLHGNHVVTVELNPQDKARLQERAGEMSHALSVQAVSSLQPGSVRVMINDTLVEDLVGNRLDALARNLLAQPEAWREQSPFFRQPLAQRDSEVQDAAARVVASRDPKPKTSSADPVDVPMASHTRDIDSDQTSQDSGNTSSESLNLDTNDSEQSQDPQKESHD